MTTKLILAATCVFVVCLYVFSLFYPNDPYFYFVSSNIISGSLRLAVVGWMVYLSFKHRFIYKRSKEISVMAALGLVGFGLVGLLDLNLDYALYSLIQPFDFMFLVGSGLYISYCSLALASGRRRFAWPNLTRDIPLLIFTRLRRV